jgi:hypothetical protein
MGTWHRRISAKLDTTPSLPQRHGMIPSGILDLESRWIHIGEKRE